MARGGFIQRPSDTGYLAIAASDQMIGSHFPPQQRVILNDIVGPFERRPVHHHDRQRGVAAQCILRRAVVFGTHHQQAIHPLLQQRFHAAIHTRHIFFCVAQDQAVATLVAAAFHAAHHFGIKRVIAGGHQHTNGTRRIEFQATRQSGRRIVKLFHGHHDFVTHAVADKAIVIDHVRNRRG
ncbi:hypothetical protein D3C80_1365540 [compost metagenome]